MKLVNRKVRRDYRVIESIEVGIALKGSEVKSLRGGQASLLGARVVVRGGELWLMGFSIAKYKFDGRDDSYLPDRPRKLLAKKREILQLVVKSRSGGLTMMPLSVYNKGGFLKVEVGLVKGKKKYEKREVLKKRKEKRNLSRRFKI